MVTQTVEQNVENYRQPVLGRTRVLIADHQPFFRELLYRSLSAERGLEVVGVAHDGESAIHLSRETTPDVVLINVELDRNSDGTEVALQIKQENPQTNIVILSNNDWNYAGSSLYRSSGCSYLTQQTMPDLATLVRVIQCSGRGMVIQDPSVTTNLRLQQGSSINRLTARQKEVLKFIAQGYSNAAIADRLVLTERTVETYISGVYQQLNISGERDIHARVKAALLYLQENLDR